MIQPIEDDIVTEKNDKLERFLKEISQVIVYEEDDIRHFESTIMDIYSGDYRQMYSMIHPQIIRIHSEGCDLDVLVSNLETIRLHMSSRIRSDDGHADPDIDNLKDSYGRLLKLSDHVSMEVQRLQDTNDLQYRSGIL